MFVSFLLRAFLIVVVRSVVSLSLIALIHRLVVALSFNSLPCITLSHLRTDTIPSLNRVERNCCHVPGESRENYHYGSDSDVSSLLLQ